MFGFMGPCSWCLWRRGFGVNGGESWWLVELWVWGLYRQNVGFDEAMIGDLWDQTFGDGGSEDLGFAWPMVGDLWCQGQGFWGM